MAGYSPPDTALISAKAYVLFPGLVAERRPLPLLDYVLVRAHTRTGMSRPIVTGEEVVVKWCDCFLGALRFRSSRLVILCEFVAARKRPDGLVIGIATIRHIHKAIPGAWLWPDTRVTLERIVYTALISATQGLLNFAQVCNIRRILWFLQW